MAESQPLLAYLREIQYIHDTGAGVKETSYYPALSNLFNTVGKTLVPHVHCIITIRNQGAGLPDGGLFTPDQALPDPQGAWTEGQIPSRGALEVKSPAEDVYVVARSDQVQRYCARYGQVLVTNLRDFLLVARSPDGECLPLERYALVSDEASLWTIDPKRLVQEHGERFVEYLRRVMVHAAPLSTPRDVAWLLASYAREALARTLGADVPALNEVRAVLEEALGMRFQGAKGRHFFRSTLVQTLFYGLFSAWVLWSREHAPTSRARFHWHEAEWKLRVPMVRALFERLAGPSTLNPLNLIEVLDWASNALNRIDRTSFFAAFREGHAVQYFYEPFLEAYDPELRKQLGVWYTPPEVVEYMVDRVDTVLREELNLADGLADPRVYVLDPCCGTGSYLVEVLRRIAERLQEKGEDALLAYDVKRAAMERIFGFELLPAPFVVAHLQLGLLLQDFGVPLSDERAERAAVYLTNALTGWAPPATARQRSFWPELEKERDAAENIKLDQPILVVIGNPPYNGFAGVAVDEERELSNAYRATQRAPKPQGQGLNDLYVRFYRMAERRIVEETGKGIVCFISNSSWLDGRSFPGMRERYLGVFDKVWIDSLNGDKYRTGKVTPWGDPDPSVFSTEFNPEGIQVGTAIALLMRKEHHQRVDAVDFRSFWGKTKRQQLLDAKEQEAGSPYQRVTPALRLGLPFAPTSTDADYLSWPLLSDLFPTSFPGVKTSRDPLVVDIDRDRLVQRIEQYFNPRVSNVEMARISPRAMQDAARFDAKKTRQYLLKRGFLPENVFPYCYRPFDVRWLYWEPETKLLDEKRAEYVPHVFEGNLWIAAAQQNRKDFDPPVVTSLCSSLHVIERGANLFPLWLRSSDSQPLLANEVRGTSSERYRANASAATCRYLETLGTGDVESLFHHVVAILYSPCYRDENAGALRHDWPRVPLPNTIDGLAASSVLGKTVARLLDVDRTVEGVTAGSIRPELRRLGSVHQVGGGAVDPDAGDLAVTVRWGYVGTQGAVMPGNGRTIERDYTSEERQVIEQGAALLGMSTDEALALLGKSTHDVYLNDRVCWSNVPANVWTFFIGGYPVIKKWLSYREQSVLGRPLRGDEARYVTQMIRRLAALLLLTPALDRNYEAAKGAIYAWGNPETREAVSQQ